MSKVCKFGTQALCGDARQRLRLYTQVGSFTAACFILWTTDRPSARQQVFRYLYARRKAEIVK
jgi:hypothetical protein